MVVGIIMKTLDSSLNGQGSKTTGIHWWCSALPLVRAQPNGDELFMHKRENSQFNWKKFRVALPTYQNKICKQIKLHKKDKRRKLYRIQPIQDCRLLLPLNKTMKWELLLCNFPPEDSKHGENKLNSSFMVQCLLNESHQNTLLFFICGKHSAEWT